MNKNLLALDIATNMGWCVHDGGGTVNLKKGFSKNRLYEIYWFLNDMHLSYNLDTIAVERIAGQHKQALIVMAMLRGVVEFFAYKHGIDVIEFSPGEIKKYYTGNGRASKEMMIEQYIKINNEMPQDDNHADAHAIFCLANE